MRRYERHVEVDYPDVDTVMPMLVAAAGYAVACTHLPKGSR